MRSHAFTLLETLAAVALLGLLAAAAVPLALRLGHGELALAGGWQARQALAAFARTSASADSDAGPTPFADHPGWWVQSRLLTPGEIPAPTIGVIPTTVPAHRWRHLALFADARAAATPLAEMLVLELEPERHP